MGKVSVMQIISFSNYFISLSNMVDSTSGLIRFHDSFLDYGLLYPERRFLARQLSPLNVALNSLFYQENA